MSESRKHARLSPSGADRWTVCPGSVQLEASFPDDSSEHADWGTAAHTVAEMILSGDDATKGAAAYKGRRIDVKAGKTIEVDADMVEVVDTYVDNIRSRVAMYEAAGALDVQLHVEIQVPIDHITGEEGATGTADAVIVATFVDRTVVDVNDLKTGRGVKVDAEDNKQMAMYAAGACVVLDVDPDEVVLVVHQPRLQSAPQECTLDISAFRELIDTITVRAARAILFVDSDTPPTASDLQPTEKGCRFCKAKATCPALQRTVQDAIGADFENLVTQKDDKVFADMPVASADLATCMNLVDLIEGWCKAVRAETERRLFDGQEVEGWKLVQGRKGSRTWSDAETAEQTLKTMRLKTEEMYDFKLISPTTAEKLHKAGAIGPRQWPKLQNLITQSEGSPSVAPADDKRPALVIQKPSADDFEVLAEEDETGGLV